MDGFVYNNHVNVRDRPDSFAVSIFILFCDRQWFAYLLHQPSNAILKPFTCQCITRANVPRFIFDFLKS